MSNHGDPVPDPRYAHCPACAGGRPTCPRCDGEGIVEERPRITAAMRPRRTQAELDAPEPLNNRLSNLKREVTTLAPLVEGAKRRRRDWGVPRNQEADDRLDATLARIRRSWRQIRG